MGTGISLCVFGPISLFTPIQLRQEERPTSTSRFFPSRLIVHECSGLVSIRSHVFSIGNLHNLHLRLPLVGPPTLSDSDLPTLELGLSRTWFLTGVPQFGDDLTDLYVLMKIGLFRLLPMSTSNSFAW